MDLLSSGWRPVGDVLSSGLRPVVDLRSSGGAQGGLGLVSIYSIRTNLTNLELWTGDKRSTLDNTIF